MFPAWQTEIGSGHIVDVRREGDHATPTGVYGFGRHDVRRPGRTRAACTRPTTSSSAATGGTRTPTAAQYNRFVHVACGTTPPFAAWSEPLWTETQGDRGYPYLAVIDYNDDPTIAGPDAPGSGIFLHAWMDAPTEGCIALPDPRALEGAALARAADHPVIEIGTDAEVGRVPPPT